MSRSTWLALIALLPACGDPTAPAPPTLEVQAVTTGQPVDPDGYAVQVDGRSHVAVGVNATIRVGDLAPGNHQVVLNGVAPNCALAGPNPRIVDMRASDVTPVRFEVQCGTPPGSIEVVIATTGDDLDPDGYLLSIDGEPGVPILGSGTVSIPNVAAGDHEIRVGGVAPNCAVAGDNPLLVPIGRDTVHVDLEIRCAGPIGAIHVSTTTLGPQPDPDGFNVIVGVVTQHIESTGALTVSGVPAVDIEVRLDSIAPNCRVNGDNPVTVTLSAGAFATVNFAVSCLPAGPGVVLFSSDRSGAYHLYRVREDGNDLRDLTPSFEATGGDWSPDGSRIVFSRPGESGPQLMVMNADGTHPTSLKIGGVRPRWSPDGRKIVFSGPDGLITVSNADGTESTPLATGADPDWSPDGTRIAFDRVDRSQCVYDLFCASSVYVSRAGGSEETVVARAAGASEKLREPDWSPDGSEIAYSRSCCFLGVGTSGVYAISARGGSPRLLYEDVPVQAGPIWSPDGSLLVVAVRSSNGTNDMMMIAAQGGGSAALAPAQGHDVPQAWR